MPTRIWATVKAVASMAYCPWLSRERSAAMASSTARLFFLKQATPWVCSTTSARPSPSAAARSSSASLSTQGASRSSKATRISGVARAITALSAEDGARAGGGAGAALGGDQIVEHVEPGRAQAVGEGVEDAIALALAIERHGEITGGRRRVRLAEEGGIVLNQIEEGGLAAVSRGRGGRARAAPAARGVGAAPTGARRSSRRGRRGGGGVGESDGDADAAGWRRAEARTGRGGGDHRGDGGEGGGSGAVAWRRADPQRGVEDERRRHPIATAPAPMATGRYARRSARAGGAIAASRASITAAAVG